MKNKFMQTIVGTLLGLLIMFGAAHVSALGQEEAKPDQVYESQGQNHSQSIVGVWSVQVTRRDCTTGAPLGPVSNIQNTFARGGTMLETVGPTAFRSQGNGIWEREHGLNQYSIAQRFMRFDSAGAFVGSGVVRVAVTLDNTGNYYDSTATNDILDINGNVIASGCATSVAMRFKGF